MKGKEEARRKGKTRGKKLKNQKARRKYVRRKGMKVKENIIAVNK
jgi:hypothetical protein